MLVDPNLIKIKDGNLVYVNRILDQTQCQAVGEFLRNSNTKQSKVKGLIFDHCQITDDGMSAILDGCVSQIKMNRRGGKKTKYYLHSFIVINSCLGPNSFKRIASQLSDELIELKIQNVNSE